MKHSAHRTRDREFKLLLAAGLLCSYERSSPEELYQKASKCYELLIDILEDADTARDVALLIGRPVPPVQNAARSIIDLLLFNKEADPFVALGLQDDADRMEANRRWKRLMILYHPDRYPDDQAYEERAKKLNESYEKLQRGQGRHVFAAADNQANQSGLFTVDQVPGVKTARKVPVFVLALMIFVCIISLWLFISV